MDRMIREEKDERAVGSGRKAVLRDGRRREGGRRREEGARVTVNEKV